MKITVDEEKCIGCGTCAIVCPDCFVIEENMAKVKEECKECDSAEAKSSCPVGAIEIEE